jgi:diguanylate cyclase (GGDEF)-like protein/PAS domain S-box-containing protein
MVWIADEHQNLEYVNERWSMYTGLSLTSGLKVQAIVHLEDLADVAVDEKWRVAQRAGDDFECEARLRCHDGTYRWHALRAVLLEHSAQSEKRKWIVTATDVQNRKSAELALEHSEAELSHRARHDPLTNLPNRSMLIERLGKMIAQAKLDGTSVVVLYLGLDHFKTVNDTLGHGAGDAVLVKTAVRISSTLRGDDTASRLAGDEFVLACPATVADATRIAERLQAAVHGPMEVQGKRLVVSCSMGISVYPPRWFRSARSHPESRSGDG